MVSAVGELGDIFWDLAPWMYYTPGYDIGCIIYVANHTDADKEYALIIRTYKNNALFSEGAIQVEGLTWFTVASEDFIRLYGTIRLDTSDVELVVELVEKETETVTDSVSTILVTPTSAVMPPGWSLPGVPTTPVSTIDWSSLIMMMMMIMMMSMMAGVMSEDEEEKKKKRLAQGSRA